MRGRQSHVNAVTAASLQQPLFEANLMKNVQLPGSGDCDWWWGDPESSGIEIVKLEAVRDTGAIKIRDTFWSFWGIFYLGEKYTEWAVKTVASANVSIQFQAWF